jgi:predicted DNA-binding protein
MSGLTHRTQLLLDDERRQRLEQEAHRTGRSVASLVREAIDARYGMADWSAARKAAAAALLASPRPADPEPDWHAVELELLDSSMPGPA